MRESAPLIRIGRGKEGEKNLLHEGLTTGPPSALRKRKKASRNTYTISERRKKKADLRLTKAPFSIGQQERRKRGRRGDFLRRHSPE